ncbi:DUF6082 family protein [Streptomyces sp. NPDC057197]|uniref:DUF6082 family protein n=1 Tax=Streptomyces sp. NPDC057197 TaxID=3346045 RepID=UPI00363E807D
MAAAEAVRTALAERHNRRQLILQATQIHAQYLADVTLHDKLLAQTQPPGTEHLGDYRKMVHSNRTVAFLSAKFRTGLLTEAALRTQARHLMQGQDARAYWRTFGGFREEEPQDRRDQRFNAIMADEYQAVCD